MKITETFFFCSLIWDFLRKSIITRTSQSENLFFLHAKTKALFYKPSYSYKPKLIHGCEGNIGIYGSLRSGPYSLRAIRPESYMTLTKGCYKSLFGTSKNVVMCLLYQKLCYNPQNCQHQ